MRIDSVSSVKTWLTGLFSGSFKGKLEGDVEGTASHATFAETASYVPYAISSSYAENADLAKYASSSSYAYSASNVETKGVVSAISSALEDPQYADVFKRLQVQGRLIVRNGDIRVISGSVGIDTGSLRIRRVVLEYLDDEEALGFKFISNSDIPPVPPLPPDPPYPPGPWPPGPWPPGPWPPPPPPGPWPPGPWPPVPPCPPPPPPKPPKTGSNYEPSIDYARAGAY